MAWHQLTYPNFYATLIVLDYFNTNPCKIGLDSKADVNTFSLKSDLFNSTDTSKVTKRYRR